MWLVREFFAIKDAGIMKRQCAIIICIILLFQVPYSYASDCTKTSIGSKPLTEMEDTLYLGKEGGLYPQGNLPPEEFQNAGIAIAKQIEPLDKEGIPDSANGKIAILSIGMSLTYQEFQEFQSLAASDQLKNPKVVFVNGAIHGVGASSVANENSTYWNAVNRTLTGNEVSSKQVQIVWLKEVSSSNQGFPKDTETLQGYLKTIAQLLKQRYVNLRIIYLSSRSYGGYANFEPASYETAFAVKWLIQAQIEGDPELNYDVSKGVIKAPILRWGPYLWADGVNPRKDNNLRWECSDFTDDGVHPSSFGTMKAAKMLLNFMQTDPTARPWYLNEDAQDNKIDPLVFPAPFPTLWLIVLICIVVIIIWGVLRFMKSRRTFEDEE